MFECNSCESKFKKYFQLLRHKRLRHQNKVYGRNQQPSASQYYQCTLCLQQFNKQLLYQTHLRKCRSDNNMCQNCGKSYLNIDTLIKHNLQCTKQIGFGRKQRLPDISKSKFLLSKQAFQSFLQQYELFPQKSFKDVEEFFSYYKEDIFVLILI